MALGVAAPTTTCFSQRIHTPLGPMVAVAGARGLALLEFADRPMLPAQLQRVERLCRATVVEGEHEYIDQTRQELGEYFLGRREVFTVPLCIDGSPFQTAVWYQLRAIPFGKTTSYDAIARSINLPGGARAVGRANGDNRIAIIVPCHRVINADGSLSGYGGGKRRKRWLLAHERRGSQLTFEGFDF
jgi:AraC family transcriptional regulator of adaptative response/methylated-DNA-[protein]-cysteine methyltransferase